MQRFFARVVGVVGFISVGGSVIVALFDFDGFGAVDNDDLQLRQHRQSFGALKNFAPIATLNADAREGPIADGIGHVGLNNSVAAHIAKIRVSAHQDDRRDGLALREAFKKLGGGGFGHQNFSVTLETSWAEKSRAMRSRAGSCSSKKDCTSEEIWYSSRKTMSSFS